MKFLNDDKEDKKGSARFEKRLVKSLRCHGFLFPSNEEELDALEKSQAAEINGMPDFLESPMDILNRGLITKVLRKDSPVDLDSSTNLAQAAREGKALSDEVKKRMQEDRRNAKGKFDGTK